MGDKPLQITVNRVNLLDVNPGSMEASPGITINTVIVTVEHSEGQIEQIGLTSEDGEKLVAGLIDALASQGLPSAMMLLAALGESVSDDDHYTDDEEDSDDPDESDELDELDDTDDPVNCEVPPFGPE